MGARTVAGVDGARGGWLCAVRAGRGIRVRLFASVAEMLAAEPQVSVFAIDIPIGLTDGARECDVEARRMLAGPRRASVFAAPLASAIRAASHEEACALTERVTGKRISIQAWGIFPKVREVHELIAARPELARLLHEAHPELVFQAMNGGTAMAHAKRRAQGAAERDALIERHLGPAARPWLARRIPGSAPDDLRDALALVWTAERIARGRAERVPREAAPDVPTIAF